MRGERVSVNDTRTAVAEAAGGVRAEEGVTLGKEERGVELSCLRSVRWMCTCI